MGWHQTYTHAFLMIKGYIKSIVMWYNYGSVTQGGLSGLDLWEALTMSKILGKIKIRLFLSQALNLFEE